MESIESITSIIFQKTFSRVVIQSENKLKFNFQGHCTLTFHMQMSACVFRSKECVNNKSVMKCLELNFWLLVCKWQKIIQDALSFSFACHDNCKSMNSQNAAFQTRPGNAIYKRNIAQRYINRSKLSFHDFIAINW